MPLIFGHGFLKKGRKGHNIGTQNMGTDLNGTDLRVIIGKNAVR